MDAQPPTRTAASDSPNIQNANPQVGDLMPWMKGSQRKQVTGSRLEEHLQELAGRRVQVVAFEEGRIGSLAASIAILVLLSPVLIVLSLLLALPAAFLFAYQAYKEWPIAVRYEKPAGLVAGIIVLSIIGLFTSGALFGLGMAISLVGSVLPFSHAILIRTNEDILLCKLRLSLFKVPVFGTIKRFPSDKCSIESLPGKPNTLRLVIQNEPDQLFDVWGEGAKTQSVESNANRELLTQGKLDRKFEEVQDKRQSVQEFRDNLPSTAPPTRETRSRDAEREDKTQHEPPPHMVDRPSGGTPHGPQRRNVLKIALIGGGVLMLVPILCCGGLTAFGIFGLTLIKQEIAEADRLWESGDKAEAVAKYKPILLDHPTIIDKADRPELFRKVIEFELAQGEIDSAKKLMQSALDKEIPITFESAEALELQREIEKESTKVESAKGESAKNSKSKSKE